MGRWLLTICLILTGALTACSDVDAGGQAVDHAPKDSMLDLIQLPDGFKIDVYAENVGNARMIVLSENGTLFVSTRRGEGNLYAVRDLDGDNFAERIDTIATGLNTPNGIALRNGSLYVAEIDKIWRYDDIEARLSNPPQPVLVSDNFPGDRHHGWKFIAFGPDDKLYLNIGAPCNVCDEGDPYATIQRMNPDGTDLEVYARGVRNSVGFTWHPENGDMWFTDNGRDMMGDDLPPCELNHAPQAGLHFGYPYFHGDGISDPEYGEGKTAADYRAPAQNLGPHVAPLGLEFYSGTQFPDKYRGRIFIAEHGSWNRSKKIGYRVTMVTLSGNEAVAYEPFAEGWLQGEENWGRPVDIEMTSEGEMLVSDDQSGRVFRIWYDG